MTGKEIVTAAFEHRRPPRTPVALIAGGEWYVNQVGRRFAEIKTDARAIAECFIEAQRKLGPDLIWTGAGLLNYPAHLLGCPIEDETSSSPALTGPALTDLDRVESLNLEAVLDHPVMRAIIASHHLVAEAVGDECMILATQWGPFTTAARLVGPEALMMATLKEPEKLTALIEFCTELNWAVSERIMAHPGIGGLNLSEPVASGDMISPETFERFVAPALKELIGRAEKIGKYSMIHICGDSSRILPQVREIAPTAFSLEAKVDLGRAKEVLGGRVCVAGNVSPTGAFLTGPPEAVRAEGRACLAAWGDAPGYILTVGCDFPKETPYENVEALMSLKGAG